MRSNKHVSNDASVRREGATLVFGGALLRGVTAGLWSQASVQLEGVTRLDLRAVERVDSAGLALLAELASRAGGTLAIDGAPSGLAELCAAYRLDAPSLGFAS